MTDDELRALELAEAEATKDLVAAAPGSTAKALGLVAREIGTSLGITCAAMPGATVLNRVLGLGVCAPASEVEVLTVLSLARERGLAIQLAPFARPPGVHDRVRSEGLAEVSRWTRFGHRLRGPLEDDSTALTIELARPSDAEPFASIICEAFGLLPTALPWIAALVGRQRWTCVVARRADAIIAGGALFVEGSSAWLGLMATAPGARRQGAQRALLARRLQLAARAGARLVSVETGSPGPQGPGPSYRNILRCGFQAVYERPNLRFPDCVS